MKRVSILRLNDGEEKEEKKMLVLLMERRENVWENKRLMFRTDEDGNAMKKKCY